jgi:methionine-rich copper-binding protein CopC
VAIGATVEDSAGNPITAANATFTTVPDTTAPTVSSIYPADNQSSVSITDNITVTFSEAMDSTYVTTNTDNTSCSGTLRLSSDNFSSCVRMSSSPESSNDNKTFTLDPYDNLTVGTTYKTRVKKRVKDTAGNAMSSRYDSSSGFTPADLTAPTVSLVTTTADNQSSVSITDNITVTFSEAMHTSYITADESTGCGASIQVSSDNFNTCVRMSDDPEPSNSNMTFTLDPVDNLTVGTTYKIRVTTGVRDTAGNAMSSQYETSSGFTPADLTAPTVSSVSTTADNQSSVSITDNITVTFSEAMDTTYVTTNTDNTSCSGTLGVSSDNFSSCVQMSSAPASSNDNMTFTLDPSDNLTGGTTYLTKVTTGVKDSAGNTLSSQHVTSSGFTTESSPDTTLLAHYAFEGNLNDNSFYNRHLTEVGSNITYSAADNHTNKSGRAALFNGTNTYAYTDNITLSDNFTVAFWTKPDSPNMVQWNSALSTGNSTTSGRFQIDFNTTDNGSIRFCAVSCYMSTTLDSNEWNHIVITKTHGNGENKKVSMYTGGSLRDNVSGITTRWDMIKFGLNRSGGGYWNGYLDEVKIYNRTFSAQEVRDLYESY